MIDMELASLTITEAGEKLRNRECTSRELTEACLNAIVAKNDSLNAYLEVFEKDAIVQAEKADERFQANAPKSALDGIPIALKDNILVSGKRCTAGSKILEPYIASYDATVVERLTQAGAVVLGKTNLDEFAMGSSTEHSAFGPTKNPRDVSRVPGGSSGGSAAAVAADMCLGALGSDTGGSIRQPASFCGITGLKPTYGRVSRSGLIAMASSLDQIGPMTKSVVDAELLFSLISGNDPRDATTAEGAVYEKEQEKDITGLTIGLPREYFAQGLDARIREHVERAARKLEEQGARLVNISLPYAPAGLAVYYLVMPSEVSANLARFDGIRYGASALKEQELWDIYFETRRTFFGDEVRRRIMLGTFALSSGYYDAYYLRAQKVMALIRDDFKKAFSNVDVILTPTSPMLPFRFGERTDDPLAMYLADIYTVSANLAGIPAISLPYGEIEGLPVGVQLMGKWFDEGTLFRIAELLETK